MLTGSSKMQRRFPFFHRKPEELCNHSETMWNTASYLLCSLSHVWKSAHCFYQFSLLFADLCLHSLMVICLFCSFYRPRQRINLFDLVLSEPRRLARTWIQTFAPVLHVRLVSNYLFLIHQNQKLTLDWIEDIIRHSIWYSKFHNIVVW